MFATIQPIMFVLLFVYVFGGSIEVPGYTDYKQYLMPGHLRPDRAVRLRVHRRRRRRGPEQGHHRPAALAADVPVGGAHRAHDVRRRAQRLHVHRDVRRGLRRRLPDRGHARRGRRGDAAAVLLQLRLQLDPGADRAVGRSRSRRPTRPGSSGCSRSRSCRRPSSTPSNMPGWLQPIAEPTRSPTSPTPRRALYNGYDPGDDAVDRHRVGGRHHRRVRHPGHPQVRPARRRPDSPFCP